MINLCDANMVTAMGPVSYSHQRHTAPLKLYPIHFTIFFVVLFHLKQTQFELK